MGEGVFEQWLDTHILVFDSSADLFMKASRYTTLSCFNCKTTDKGSAITQPKHIG